MAHNYDVGTRAWQPDPTEGWIASEVQSKNVRGDKVTLVFELGNGEVGGNLHDTMFWYRTELTIMPR